MRFNCILRTIYQATPATILCREIGALTYIAAISSMGIVLPNKVLYGCMPAITTQNLQSLDRLSRPDAEALQQRPVLDIIDSHRQLEGAGFEVRRPFPSVKLDLADPFLLFDHLGAVEYAPGEARGAPWHPHRGFETVTYVMDGFWRHRDSLGGGGLIGNGSTQWMTAGAGILHDELPTEELVARGGLFHGVQLWVNLPSDLKMVAPRYQDISAERLTLLSSHDGASLVRLIAGSLGSHEGPGVTHTPITYVHASVTSGSRLEMNWNPKFNALVYALAGSGSVGAENRPLSEGQMAVLGNGEFLSLGADPKQPANSPTLEVLILGGAPIREPVVRHGPFAMNTKAEIVQAIEDFEAGRMGNIPAEHIGS